MAKDYVSVSKQVFTTLWGKHNAALTFYMALSSLVTIEIPDTENPGCKVGIVLGGTKLNDKALAARLGQPERLIRNGRDELAQFDLILKRQYPYEYKLAIRFSDKWSTKNQGKMGPKYEWVIEAQVADNPRPDETEVAAEPRPLAVQPRPLSAEPRPLAVQPRPVDSEPLIAEDLLKGKSSLKSSRKAREKGKQTEIENPDPSPSLSESKAHPSGQDRPDLVSYVQQIAKATDADASFSLKSIEALRAVCQDSDLTLPEIKMAVEFRVASMDDFQLKNAGSLIAANLQSDIDLIRRRKEKERATQEMLRASTVSEREKALAEQAAHEAARKAEEALIEDELPNPESLSLQHNQAAVAGAIAND